MAVKSNTSKSGKKQGNKFCSVEGCNNIHEAFGFCSKHYQRFKKYGSIEKQDRRICSVVGCDNVHEAFGFCVKHYKRFKKYGSTMLPERIQQICCVEGCKRNVYGNGYCGKHYQQIYKYGKIKQRTIQDLNEIRIENDICIMDLYDVEGNKTAETFFDIEDFEKVSQYKWCYDGRYAWSNKAGFLHRFILGLPRYKNIIESDHKDRDKLNNRRYNLRECTHTENALNTALLCTNTSGYKGVSWDKRAKKWAANIYIEGKKVFLCRSISAETCAATYNKAARDYYGDFAYLNKIGDNYGKT